MEMSDEIYANTAHNEADSSDSDNSYEEVYGNEDNLETQRAGSLKQSENSGFRTTEGRCYRVTAVCLLLLCVLLLTAVIVLWIKFNNLTTENIQLQTSYNNLTNERDQLQTSYNTMTNERDQLQTSYNNLTNERDQLQTSYNTMTNERDQLQTSYNTMTNERDQLQNSYNTLTHERDQLQSRYNNLTNDLQNKLSPGWLFFNSKLYYISTEKKTWTESRQDCKNRGLDLAIINSKEEQELVESFRKRRNHGIYIGLTDTDKEGVWKWVDGTSLTTAYWSSGNSNSDSEDCVTNGYQNDNGWYDRPCTETYHWICE